MTIGIAAVRLSKIVMTGGLALFAFLVTLGNITDPGSNWAFVQHVLAMDTVFPDSTLTWRAITDPTVQLAAYVAIILAEALTCFAFAAATWAMAAKFRASKAEFQRAKSLTAVGVLLGFGLWFIGFMAIGGEWFAMWQSSVWNGQTKAFQFYVTILGVGIYVFLDTDGEPA
ncbi:MAG: DUF2165 domain-containing protein [Pseudomonadota bacterium]